MNETAKQTVFSTTQNRYFCVLFTLLQKYWDKNTIEQTNFKVFKSTSNSD